VAENGPKVKLMAAIDSGIDTLTPVTGLSVALSGGVLSVTINRPDSLNSLTASVLAGIADAMEHAASDPRVKVVRLGGAGRGFKTGISCRRRCRNPAVPAWSRRAESVHRR
jgi:enoyl-CoA hydratase